MEQLLSGWEAGTINLNHHQIKSNETGIQNDKLLLNRFYNDVNGKVSSSTRVNE